MLGARWVKSICGRVRTVPAFYESTSHPCVPLSAPVIALLKHMNAQAIDEYVFRTRAVRWRSNMALQACCVAWIDMTLSRTGLGPRSHLAAEISQARASSPR